MNVLVVEDVPDVALTFAALIRAYGHRTQVAYDAGEALQIAREFKPQAVFVDIGLPGMDGYELAKHLREIDGLDKSLLVSISGHEIDYDRWERAGLNMHLTKPVRMDRLMEILATSPAPS